MPEEFNSVESSIKDIEAHLKTNPDDAGRILEAELARDEADQRGSLVKKLQAQLNPVTPETPGEPPALKPGQKRIHGKVYEQTAEEGWRVVG